MVPSQLRRFRACYNARHDGILVAIVANRAGFQEEDGVEGNGWWPECTMCEPGKLLPLSDFGSQGAPIHYKAWVCSNPDCGFNIKIRNGDVYLNEPIASGVMHTPRVR